MADQVVRKIRWMGSVALIAAVLTFSAVGSGAAHATTAPVTPEGRAAAYVRPGIMFLETVWQFRLVGPVVPTSMAKLQGIKSRCTGFVVSADGYIASAGHCVDPEQISDTVLLSFIQLVVGNQSLQTAVLRAAQARGVTISTVNDLAAFVFANWKLEGAAAGTGPDRRVFAQQGVAVANLTGERAWPARVIDFRPLGEGDVALIKVEQEKLPVVEVSDARHVEIGTPVLSVGFPATNDAVTDVTWEPTFKDGSVSSKRTHGSYPVFETSAALSGGMSGGPTVDNDGRVVGVNSFGHARETGAFKFVSSSSLILELLRGHGVENRLSDIDTTYRAGVDAYFAGDLRGAVGHFDDVLARSPAHRQAQDLRVKAADQLAAQGENLREPAVTTAPSEPSTTTPAPLGASSRNWLVPALVLLVLAAPAALLLRRRTTSARTAAVATTSSEAAAPSATANVQQWWMDAATGSPSRTVDAPAPVPVASSNGHAYFDR